CASSFGQGRDTQYFG
nr:TcR V13J2.5 beta chain {clone Mouse2A9, complementarity determining region 3} [mice, CBA/J, induced autoimmune thyroiditic, thyroid, Peptide Partial, 15 aa] [Mus sp.]